MTHLTDSEISGIKEHLDGWGKLYLARGPMGAVQDFRHKLEFSGVTSGASASVFRLREFTTLPGNPKGAEVVAPNMLRYKDAEFLRDLPDLLNRMLDEIESKRKTPRWLRSLKNFLYRTVFSRSRTSAATLTTTSST